MGIPLDNYDTDIVFYFKKEVKDKPIDHSELSNKLAIWIAVSYSTSDIKRVMDFFFIAPLVKVPLYINDGFLKPFVKWRIEIRK